MLAVLSGKGGTGKTTVSVLLSYAFSRPLVGADVESPTTMIVYGDRIIRRRPVYRRHAKVIEESCVSCGTCASVCPFGAILMLGKAYVDPEACEGCLACLDSCPTGAIIEEKVEVGEIRYGKRVVEGALKPGEKESRVVLEEVLKEAPENSIIDGAPGTSPLVYRIARRADEIILVVEPTKTSVADATRVLEMLSRMKKPVGIVINKYGLGDHKIVEELAKKYEVPIIGRLPFNKELFYKKPLEVKELIDAVSSFEFSYSVPKSFLGYRGTLEEPKEASKYSPHITIVSGKGGTGKTLLAIGLSKYLNLPLVDADVDAPDSRVILGEPERKRSVNGRVYSIDPDLCDGCGECLKACYNGSIEKEGDKYRISPEICEGCGICSSACPRGAIKEEKRAFGYIGMGDGYIMGESDIGRAGIGEMVHKLKLVASNEFNKYVLDGSPGSGCTTISAISGAKAVIIVTEPKPESLESAKRVSLIAKHFGIKPLVVINKRNGEDVDVSEIGELLGHIPFDEGVFEAYAKGTRPEGTKAAEAIKNISRKLLFEYLSDFVVKEK